MNATLYGYRAMPLLCVIGLLFWPTAIAFGRGYRRARIGVGFDEFRVVTLAGIVIVAASAVPAGFLAASDEGLDPSHAAVSPLFALLRVVVVGAPIAVVLSLIARLSSPETPSPLAEARPGYPAHRRRRKLCCGPAAH